VVNLLAEVAEGLVQQLVLLEELVVSVVVHLEQVALIQLLPELLTQVVEAVAEEIILVVVLVKVALVVKVLF
jgi:hypothetical protein